VDATFRLFRNIDAAKERTYWVKSKSILYFAESVRGLDIGAPVEFYGIQMGEVIDVKLDFDKKKEEFRIRVVVETETERFMEAGFVGDEAERQKLFESLLDRGFAYAIAHIRGGEEMGRHWYEDGKLLKKKNTFYDFIDTAEHLIKEKVTTKDQLVIAGGSAGGLLVGACVTMRPDLFHFVIPRVPFVDVITTMLDESIPLTAQEWKEWGNPKIKEEFDYMLSYSPYDQVKSIDYPHMLVTTGLNDPRVAFWEPAKFVAKLRELKTDSNDLLLKTNMGAGHHGASGRYQYLKETAFIYANVLDKLNLVSK